MLITNTEEHGGALSSVFYDLLEKPETKGVQIVSGYVGKETIKQVHRILSGLETKNFELVVGMAAKEGLAQGTYDALIELNSELKEKRTATSPNSGIYAFFTSRDGKHDRGMHAKAYLFDQQAGKKLVIGSSNFSHSGLSSKGNVEMNVVTESLEETFAFENFYRDLHDNGNAIALDLIGSFPIRGKASKLRKAAPGAVRVAKPTDFKNLPFVEVDLAQNIENKKGSNLNCFFGKGRLASGTGIITPRDWYEVELICPREVTAITNYPRGDFQVTTSDGFSFPAKTQGDGGNKNLRSTGDLKILGMWIKGLLEDTGSLSDDPYELVTKETFEHYGNSMLRIYRDSPKSAIFHFPRSITDL